MKPSFDIITDIYVATTSLKYLRIRLVCKIGLAKANILLSYPTCGVIVLYFVFLFVQTVQAQTAIVLIRTPSEIVAAADSKAVSQRGKVSTECKIKQVSKVFFAKSGLYYATGTGFVLD